MNGDEKKVEQGKSARRITAEGKRDEAARLLMHHLQAIGMRSGWSPTTDVRVEIQSIATLIVDAAVLLAQEEIEQKRAVKA